jgi:hypothetical protein
MEKAATDEEERKFADGRMYDLTNQKQVLRATAQRFRSKYIM